MTTHHLAQMNVATILYALDDPRMGEFMANLDRINALAEQTPGFIWRLAGEGGNATSIRVGDDPRFLVNMSVWSSAETLFDFVYRTAHTGFLNRRREWFARAPGPYQLLWWIPAGHIPTVEEGLARLRYLDAHGPSPFAFTFKVRYPAPGTPGVPSDLEPERYCAQ